MMGLNKLATTLYSPQKWLQVYKLPVRPDAEEVLKALVRFGRQGVRRQVNQHRV